MGFYAPAQLVRDAVEHGVPVRPVDVNLSVWDCTLEGAPPPWLAVRQGLRMVKSLHAEHGARIVERRPAGGYRSIEELWRRAEVPVVSLRAIAMADGFGSLNLNRREALWSIRALGERPLDLFAAADARDG
jgi:error-prone DNA polymerase